MNTEERDLITRFIERVGGRAASAGAAFGSVPSTAVATNPLPPVDPEADALLNDLFARYPEARYRVTQMAFIQEHALVEAQNRINRLQWELTQLRQSAAPPAPAASPWGQPAQSQPAQQQYQNPPPSRGIFGGLFGGSRQPDQQQQYAQPQQPQYAPPQPQYAPGYQPGMFQQRGSGFLGSALTTAAGVAGGMVAGNALMNMFSGSHGAAQAASSTVSDATAGALPWAPTPDAGGQSAWTPVDDPTGGAAAGGWSNPTSYDTPAPDSGWSDSSSDGGSDSSWSDPDQG